MKIKEQVLWVKKKARQTHSQSNQMKEKHPN